MAELESERDRTRRYGNTFALVLCDLDDFKAINDTQGHLAGDAALQRVAAVLTAALRSSDRAFRIGGDEFALLLPEAAAQEAAEAVTRLTTALASDPGAAGAQLSASFGSAVFPGDGDTATELVRTADERLYAAKRVRQEGAGG
jgi:diguanylate cyclase (GGDEF)-like protein